MNILVIGPTQADLIEWRHRNFTQAAVHRSSGTVTVGNDRYWLFATRPNDERIMEIEFQRMIVLPKTNQFGIQYQLRVRP